jgi:hypothetical protein
LKVGKFLLTLYLEHWPTVTSPVGFLHWWSDRRPWVLKMMYLPL